MLERSGHNLEPIPKTGIVFKLGLPLGAESAKRNFRAEHFPELLLQIEFHVFAVVSVNFKVDMILFGINIKLTYNLDTLKLFEF
jgi:hypothetical protein